MATELFMEFKSFLKYYESASPKDYFIEICWPVSEKFFKVIVHGWPDGWPETGQRLIALTHPSTTCSGELKIYQRK